MLAETQQAGLLERPNPFAALFEEIERIARKKLRGSSYFELHDVDCDFSGGVLTLRGRVTSYHLKQLAQASVAELPGVVEIDNRLEVTLPRQRQEVESWRRERIAAK